MGNICPYVFCPKCKHSNSWVRHKAKDVIRERDGEVMWKGWKCRYCGDVTLTPTKLITDRVSKRYCREDSYSNAI